MKLTNYLKKLPLAKLVEFIGPEVIKGLQRYDVANDQGEIAQVLRELKGNEIFRESGLLRSVLWNFSDPDLREFSQICGDTEVLDFEDYRLRLLQKGWGNNDFSKSILSFFEIDDVSYLAVDKVETADREVVIPRLSETHEMFGDYPIFTPEMYPLHPYQKATKDQVVDRLLEPGSRFILHMPTGAGKTKTAVESMVDFWRVKGKRQGFMVWFAHSKELCEQAYDTFKETWAAKGDYSIEMFKVFETHTPDLSNVENGVIFVGFQKFNSLINKNHPVAVQIKNTTRLIVVDEAHKTIAQTYLSAVGYVLSPDSRLMGLTATPGRSGDVDDPENAALSAFYHNNKITISDEHGIELLEPIRYLQENGYLAKLERIKVDSNVVIENDQGKSKNGVDTISAKAKSILTADDIRNSKILAEIEKAVVDRKHPTLVFSTDLAHAVILKILLNKKGIKSECVLGNTPSNLRSKYIEDFKKGELPVLVNFGVLTTGFDAPNIRTLVISRPTTSIVLYSQMLGRALRGPKMGGAAAKNILVDIVDNYCEFGTERAAFSFFDEFYSTL